MAKSGTVLLAVALHKAVAATPGINGCGYKAPRKRFRHVCKEACSGSEASLLKGVSVPCKPAKQLAAAQS
jgi:hypothetical protein